MAFLSDFAQGFFTTSADTVLDNKKRQDEVDDYRKKKLAEVDPAADLYKRNKAVDLETKKEEQKFQNDNFAEMLDRMKGGSASAPTNPNTVDTPSSGGGFMTPPTDKVDPLTKTHSELQDALKMKAVAAASGNKQQEQYWDTVIDMKKSQYTYESDTAKNNTQPVKSAEGTNITDQIQKDNEDKLKNPTKYQSDYLPPKVNGLLAQPDIAKVHEESVVKHAALAQAVSEVTKRANPAANTAEVYPLIKEKTKQIITNINIINSTDPRISEGEKQKAISDIETAVKAITKDDPAALDALKSNPNYAAIFDDMTMANIEALAGSAQPTDGTAKPVELKGAEEKPNAAIQAAKDAIARGASKDKVIQRLKEHGIDTTGL